MNIPTPSIFLRAGFAALLFCYLGTASASAGIGVLAFELKDITSNPNIPEEVARTAALQPALEQALQQRGYAIATIPRERQRDATPGDGYLYDYPEAAAALGAAAGARFVVVGRVSKPSFLFVHFLARLVDVETKKIVNDYVVEVKGQHMQLTGKGVRRLAEQIDEGAQRYLGSR